MHGDLMDGRIVDRFAAMWPVQWMNLHGCGQQKTRFLSESGFTQFDCIGLSGEPCPPLESAAERISADGTRYGVGFVGGFAGGFAGGFGGRVGLGIEHHKIHDCPSGLLKARGLQCHGMDCRHECR